MSWIGSRLTIGRRLSGRSAFGCLPAARSAIARDDLSVGVGDVAGLRVEIECGETTPTASPMT